MELDSNNNLNDNDLNKIKVLIIYILWYLLVTINNKDYKSFFTSFGPIKYIKVIATHFTNQLFSHFLSSNSKYLSNNINPSNANYIIADPNLFIYITIEQ